MRFILALVAAGVGYNYVSSPSQPPAKVSVQQPAAPSVADNFIKAATDLVSSASDEAQAAFKDATRSLPIDQQMKLDRAASEAKAALPQAVPSTVAQRGSSCGEPDRFGNLKYCFHDH